MTALSQKQRVLRALQRAERPAPAPDALELVPRRVGAASPRSPFDPWDGEL